MPHSSENTKTVFIKNAGLIILWPFFVHLFQRLNLTKDDQFVSREAAAKACLYLHYLVNKNTSVSEHELCLNKLLCGLPEYTAIPETIDISDSDKELLNELLNVVISRWNIIDNISPDGLREIFLIRSGKLITNQDDQVNLKVDQKAYDLLLNHIPWSISVIRLPWMKTALYNQWR